MNFVPMKPMANDRMGPDKGGHFLCFILRMSAFNLVHQFELLWWGTYYLLILVSDGNLPGLYFIGEHHQRQTLFV